MTYSAYDNDPHKPRVSIWGLLLVPFYFFGLKERLKKYLFSIGEGQRWREVEFQAGQIVWMIEFVRLLVVALILLLLREMGFL